MAESGGNADKRAEIERAAFRLFRESGYRLTSYTRIAEESGVGRPLVQYYFPKKEDLATGFVFRMLAAVSESVDATGQASEQPYGYLTQLGQVYYSFLLKDANMRRLTLDLFANRQVTSQVIEANVTYTLPFVKPGGASDPALADASIKATGGVYELVFRGLSRGQELDPADLSVQNTAAFMALSSRVTYEDAKSQIKGQLLADETIRSIFPKLSEALFG